MYMIGHDDERKEGEAKLRPNLHECVDEQLRSLRVTEQPPPAPYDACKKIRLVFFEDMRSGAH